MINWTGGPFAVGENTYDGFIDSPASNASVSSAAPFAVTGWVVDRTAEGWAGVDDVHVYRGVAGEGGTFLGRALFAQNRPDVGSALGNPFWAASGFSFTVPANTLSPGTQTLSVYAHTPGKGWWYKQVTIEVTQAPATSVPSATPTVPTSTASGDRFPTDPMLVIVAPKSDERVGTNHYTIRGYALDRNATQGVGIDRVEIYIDTPRDAANPTLLGTATLGQSYGSGGDYGSQFALAGWGLDIDPGAITREPHTIYVYARSSVTGKEVSASVTFRIVRGSGDAQEQDDD
jgi:hypothetical protein